MKKIVAALTVSLVALGIGAFGASPASAHTPNISASCDGVRVAGSAYDAGMDNRWSVTIAGTTQSGTFETSFDQTFPVPQDGATTTWSAFVEAEDGSFHGEKSGSVGPCGTPPVDVCTDLPGPQPEGTECTPPPAVERVDAQQLEGCAVAFEGTEYGAGVLTYDELYTDTYVFNEVTNTFELVLDTTATIANLDFSPWSMQQQVENGCIDKDTQPPAESSSQQSSEVNCASNVVVTTTVTTTTEYVYDAATNTWVLGEPVSHTTTEESPVQPGDCDDTEVLPAQAKAPNSTQSQTSASASSNNAVQLPTSVDAGLAGGVPQVTPVADGGTHRSGLPALVLLMAGLALLGGALRARRN